MQQDSAERRRITRNVLLALLTILLLAAVLYIAVQLYAILHRTYRTETAIKATMSDSVLLNGAAVFPPRRCRAAATWDIWSTTANALPSVPHWQNTIPRRARTFCGRK